MTKRPISDLQSRTLFGYILLTLSLVLGIISLSSFRVSAVTAPNRTQDTVAAYKNLLAALQPTDARVIQSVDALLQTSAAADLLATPSVMLVSFYDRGGRIEDLVIQLFRDDRQTSELSNPDGVLRARVGKENYQATDMLLQAIHRPSVYLGPKAAADRQRRAFEASLAGDLTFLREMTVEPLRVIAVVPAASRFLPSSLGDRVQSLVIDSKLSFGKWDTQTHFISKDDETAQQVGFVVAGWRELAVYLSETFAAHGTGRQLQQALRSASVQVVNNRVVGTTSLPAGVAVRAAKEVSGHGGGCPPGGSCKKDKVEVCHMPPQGNAHTVCVNPNAVPAHLAHGDFCGPCTLESGPGNSAGKSGPKK